MRPCVSSSEHFLNIFGSLFIRYLPTNISKFFVFFCFLSYLHVGLQRECVSARLPTYKVSFFCITYAKGFTCESE